MNIKQTIDPISEMEQIDQQIEFWNRKLHYYISMKDCAESNLAYWRGARKGIENYLNGFKEKN